ncbi:MAG: hypothetical protein EB069_03025 [Actinobacteria bacterium]|nr:hypothetical protein [Actinomycetota bacterium]
MSPLTTDAANAYVDKLTAGVPDCVKNRAKLRDRIQLGLLKRNPLLVDERSVAVHVRGKGQFVFSACSHAGIINVLRHAKGSFPDVPLYGTMGGFHLSGNTEAIIPQTVADLGQFGLKLLAPGHCTGWRALTAISKVFGEEVVPSAVGKRYLI